MTGGTTVDLNCCDSLFQEQTSKHKKRHNHYHISFQSFSVSVLLVRLEPFSDPLLPILKKGVGGHKRQCLIETCRLDVTFVISEAHTVGVHRAGSLGISFSHTEIGGNRGQGAMSLGGTKMWCVQMSKGECQKKNMILANLHIRTCKVSQRMENYMEFC